jgi:hypothetical protein
MPILPAAMNRFEAEIIATVERLRVKHGDDPAPFRRAADAYVEDVAMRLENNDGRGVIRALASRHADRAYAKLQYQAAAKNFRSSGMAVAGDGPSAPASTARITQREIR